jgi:hypothetical protein
MDRMDEETLGMAAGSIITCMNDLKLCVRLGPGNTFKPEGEVKMSLTEFLRWVRDKKTG